MFSNQIDKSLTSQQLASLTLGTIGVVFGDIGTSPLYAVKEIFRDHLSINSLHILGVLSLIFWSLMLIVALKYAVFIMRANNKGEGGVIALTALALSTAKHNANRRYFIMLIGLFGATLFYGDSIITPAISVLGAVEGLNIIAKPLEHFVVPITLIVLTFLFIIQSKGTASVGKLFSPVMCIWFVSLAVMGINQIIHQPQVLIAINPYYGFHLLSELGTRGFLIMGAVVLVLTGAEALYADMGHFGLKPIRYAWFGFVFPALLCNYFGQGALLLQNPSAIENPFYLLAPAWALYPLLILSTLATVIASQAVISGAFSMTKQAIQLGYCPRMAILHTSESEIGQIYVPAINWLLMLAVFILVMSFESSSNLASAYGIAVTGTMLITTVLSFIVISAMWHWHKITSYVFLIIFFSIDFIFLSSNSLKILSGGWLPLVVGGLLFLLMMIWIQGRAFLTVALEEKKVSFEALDEKIKTDELVTVKGTAIYLTKTLHGIPQVLLNNLEHNHAIHQKVIVLTISITESPFIDENDKRVKIRHFHFGNEQQFYRVKLYFGFMENPDVYAALKLAIEKGLDINPTQVSFFIGNEHLAFKRHSPFPIWKRAIFLFLFKNARSAVDFFNLPVENVVELGVKVEL